MKIFRTLKVEFGTIQRLDALFFTVFDVLHDKYKDNNVCVDSLCGETPSSPPVWDNFNQFQVEEHLKQITTVEKQ